MRLKTLDQDAVEYIDTSPSPLNLTQDLNQQITLKTTDDDDLEWV